MDCQLFAREIASGVFRISDALHGPSDDGFSDMPGKATQNSYLIVGQKKAALIDLAVDTPELFAYAQQLAGRPVQLFLTHGHPDHIYHIDSVPEAWLHPADHDMLKMGIGSISDAHSDTVLHALHDGQTIELGDRFLDVIALPGHTLGSVLFLDRKTGILLSGDTCARRLLYGVTPTVPLSDHCEYLEKLLRLSFNTMYTAHDRCGLPKDYLRTILHCIRKELPKPQKTIDLPGLGRMRNLHWGNEDSLDYFDMAVPDAYVFPNTKLKVARLRTLCRKNPVGIDEIPHFSWIMQSQIKDTHQLAWQIRVYAGPYLCWDSGFVSSDQQHYIVYQGKPLKSRTKYCWKLTVWDNHGQIATGEAAFETAFLHQDDWQGKWIEASFDRPEITHPPFWPLKPPVWFEKRFRLKDTIRFARLYATAHGVYHPYINRMRPDDREFAPEHTVYEKIQYYQTYDVTKLLISGENMISFHVGDGWYLCPQTRQQISGFTGRPAVLFQLEVTYSDGERETIFSDGSESCRTGQITWSDIFLGEKQDDTLSDGNLYPVTLGHFSMNQLCAQSMEPVRPVQLLPCRQIYRSPRGEWIADFGQIICGRARIQLDVPAGQEITLEYFEIPDSQGNYLNTMIAPQKDIYVSDGKPHIYEAAFTFHGFRYLRISGMDRPRADDFTAVALSSEKENLSFFRCSDARLNRLYENIRWSQRNNMLSIPTDCPTREKAGFTGDIQIYAKTALLNEEMTPFLTSWLRNLATSQADNGAVPITVPETAIYRSLMEKNAADFGDVYPVGVAGWSDAAVLVPWAMYQATGNVLILEQQYASMLRWCEYIIRTADDRRGDPSLPASVDGSLWNTGFHFGEWLIPSEKGITTHRQACEGSAFYTAPVFGYVSVSTMAKIAKILGKPEADSLARKASEMKAAIRRAFGKHGDMRTDHMGAYVLMLAFDLVSEEKRPAFVKRLVSLLEQNDGRLDTGFLATPYLLDTLTQIGRKDLAVSLLFQNKMPSWLYEVEHGATAIWESWDAVCPGMEPKVTSYDHYALGCVESWIFEQVAGIRARQPGFREIEIHPEPDLLPLTCCEQRFRSEYGEIAVSWDSEALQVTIPCGVTAHIKWKGREYHTGSGNYLYQEEE